MANERLFQFPSKASPVPADIIYLGDSADSFNEVQSTIAELIAAYPNLLGIGGLTMGNNTYAYKNNSGVWTAGSISAAGVSLLALNTVTISPTASSYAGWDANKNLSANNFLSGYTTTATAAGTTTLAVGSTFQQFFTGSTTQTVILPVTSTLVLGQSFYVVNNSSGVVTVQSSGANTVVAMAANTTALITCILTSGTTAASWFADYQAGGLTLPVSLSNGGTGASLTADNGGIVYSTGSALAILAHTTTASQVLLSGNNTTPSWSTATYPATATAGNILYASGANVIAAGTPTTIAALFTLPTIQTFTTGSGTYTTPANVRYLKIRIVGGGGGGAGSGTTPGAGGNGGDTTFSTLTAAKGTGASATATQSTAGGAGSGGNVLNITGGFGGGTSNSVNTPGGMGGQSPLGLGAPGGSLGGGAGVGALGYGGGGSGAGSGANAPAGGGGGAGGYVEHILDSPAASYSYSVGAGGAAGTLGTAGSAGGSGTAGIVIVEEYYI